MQKRNFYLTAVMVLIALMFLSLGVPLASAYKASANWGSYYLQDANEIADEYEVCQSIYNYMDGAYNWDAVNFCGSSTTASNVYQTNINVRDSGTCSYLATFHVGNWFCSGIEGGYWDFVYYGEWPIWEWISLGYTTHYNYYSYDGTGAQIAEYLIPYCSKTHFTFIYTCMNGGLYWNEENGQIVEGPVDAGNQYSQYPNDNELYAYLDTEKGTGRVGMPYAWLGTTSRSTDGYNDPDGSGYCYIGFQGRDPDLHQVWEQGSFDGTFRYKHWVQYFYYRLSSGDTIKEALDWATNQMGGDYDYFDDSLFYKGYNFGYDTRPGSPTYHEWVLLRQMRVFGDGNIYLV